MTDNTPLTIKGNIKQTLPYGRWPSAISAELIVTDSLSLDEPIITSDSIYYIERRPNENGRCVIVIASLDKKNTEHLSRVDILPKPFSTRSRVHEYGGGCYCLSNNSSEDENQETLLFFVNDEDQDIYCIQGGQIRRITRTNNSRFADIVHDNYRSQLIAICETHENETVTNSIVGIDISNGEIRTLAQGHDFYASPRLNAVADRLCWQSWDQPNMPWDGNQLWLANIDNDGNLGKATLIAGGENISTFQPQWSPDDILYYISDDTGWWQLYRYLDDEPHPHCEQLSDGEKEFGLPQWVFAQSSFAFLDSETIICCYQSQGETTLATLSLPVSDKAPPILTTLTTPWQEFSSIAATGASKTGNGKHFCFIAASNQDFPQLISASLEKTEEDMTGANKIKMRTVQTSYRLPITSEHYSIPQTKIFTNRHNKKVYANYYPPTNPEYIAGENQQPPLIVICHGGPTGQSSMALDPKKQFWTSRGFALLDVNYSGSTGYGREYRLRLDNKWGQLDVEDCVDAALYAVSQNIADKDRLIIRGSSAGGYTVLSALTFHTTFSAGASYYGISELCSLAKDTHKFEARYLDRLIGPYPETKTIYEQRSPINHTEQLNCPVIFFQGIEDRVVPKEQAEKMFVALKNNELPVAAQYFKNEQHGFRKAETIVHALENELSFYQLIFGLKPGDEVRFKGDIQLANIQ